MENRQYIGVFDSGVGGLTVVREIMKLLPHENIVYLADTANIPYGDKTKEEVRMLAFEDVRFLNAFPLKALVIACNTIDSVCGNEIRENSKIPVIRIVSPTSRKAVSVSRNKKIGVLATNTAIRSSSYQKELASLDEDVRVTAVACPKLVGLIENDQLHSEEMNEAIDEYLSALKEDETDAVILGCTHYPIIAQNIAEKMPEVSLISSSLAVAEALRETLKEKDRLNEKDDPEILFYASSDLEDFQKKVDTFVYKGFTVRSSKIKE